MERRSFFREGLLGLARDLWKSPLGRQVETRMHGLANLLSPQGLDHMLEEQARREAAARKDATNHGTATTDADPDAVTAPESAARPGNIPLDSRKARADARAGLAFARPPGALPDPVAFSSACSRCGDCVVACPHGAIFTFGGPASGPILNPNAAPCHLCDGFPCIAACETGALRPLPADTLPKFGQARLVPGRCINELPNTVSKRTPSRGSAQKSVGRKKPCRECEIACPVPSVIQFRAQGTGRARTQKSARLPEFAGHCTGCGLCLAACPATPLAIQIEI